MKKLFNFRLLVLIGVLIMSVSQMWARTYSGEEILYIKNIKPSGWGDTWCSSKVWVTFDNGSINYEGQKLEGSDNTVGTLYAVQVPNGTYTSVTIYRGSTVGTSWNKTGKITLDASKNCITSYSENNTSASWENVDLFNNGSVMYLIRGWDWNQGNERYAAYFFDGQHSEWVSLTNHSGDIYKCTIPTRKWARIIMCRMNGANNTNNWGNKWYQTTNISPSGTGNCVYITSNSSDGNAHDNWRLGKYAPTPAIAGDMNSWSPTANQFSGTPKRLKMDLPAGKAYNFKLANGEDNDWYGSGTTDNDLTFVGQTNSETLTTRKNNVMLLTAEAGEYTFEWSGTALTITYPSTTHPSMNYVYMPKFGDWNSGNYCYIHYWYTSGSDVPLTIWGTNDPKIKASTTINSSSYYMFPILADYPKFKAKNNIGDATEGHGTDDMTTTNNGGKYTEYITSAWGWRNWSFTVTLDEQAVCVSAPDDPTVQFNGTALSNSAGAVTVPVRTGYTFGGYYNTTTCNDLQIITNTGAWQGSKSGYTDASRKWIHQGGTATLYAKWTAKTYDLTFNDEDATTAGGNSKRTVTYDASTNLGAVTCPQREGYTFNGYWTTASGEGSQIFGANGSLISNVTDYISSGTWVYDGDIELHARWTDDGTYYFHGGASGTNTAWATAANWTKGAVPGSTSNVIILKPVVVTTGTTKTVNSIKIATEGSYTPNGGSAIEAAGKLTIPAEAMLVVTTSVQNCVITDNAAASASSTTAATLHIESGAAGNGALVWGEEDFTPGYAQVDFYTKSHGEKDQNSSINQYIGTPFSNEQSILYQYYYSWLFKIKRTAGVLDWDLMSGDESMNEFEGYNLITAYDKGTVYQMEGILVSNEDVELNGSSTPALVYTSGTGSNPNNENVLANSWVAPILIKNFVDGNFTNVDKSIYIFNAGSPNDAASGGTTAGNYTTYSISTIKAEGTNEVIPSMQSFSVYTSGASPSLTLDYSDLVQANASNSLIEPNHAPSHYMNNQMDLLKVRVEGANGWADALKVYIRDDFSTDFEDGWDAHKMYGYPEAPQLYAVTTDGNMAINCVPTADNNVLGFTPGSEDNEYTFSFTYDGDEEYYLKDTKLNIETQINAEATYTFTSEAEDSDMRFMIIKHAPAVATGAEAVSGDQLAVSGVQKIMHNGQLYIIRDGGIYDATGAMVK